MVIDSASYLMGGDITPTRNTPYAVWFDTHLAHHGAQGEKTWQIWHYLHYIRILRLQIPNGFFR